MERIPVGPLYGKDVYDRCNHLDFMSGILRSSADRRHDVFARGRSASTQVSLLKNPNAFYAETWQARKGCLSHLTFRPTAAMMRITPVLYRQRQA